MRARVVSFWKSCIIFFILLNSLSLIFTNRLSAQVNLEGIDPKIINPQLNANIISSAITKLFKEISELLLSGASVLKQIGSKPQELSEYETTMISEDLSKNNNIIAFKDSCFPKITGQILRAQKRQIVRRKEIACAKEIVYEKVLLKNGAVIEGFPIEEKKDYIRMAIADVPVTFFSEEIQDKAQITN